MNDIGETIESFIIDKIEETIDEKVNESVDNSYVVQDLRNDVDDIRSQVENLDETAIAQVVVDTMVSKIIGDEKKVYQTAYVTKLVNRVNELEQEIHNLKNPKPTAINE
jgi:polyhydroxyalkanoate synthesis regulator phasin